MVWGRNITTSPFLKHEVWILDTPVDIKDAAGDVERAEFSDPNLGATFEVEA